MNSSTVDLHFDGLKYFHFLALNIPKKEVPLGFFVVLIRRGLANSVQAMKSDSDYSVSLKLVPPNSNMIPVIIGFTYITPECSAIHQYLHESLWLSRSKEIESFQQLGPTLVVGDWNVRIGDLKMTWTLKNSIFPGP